MCVGLVDMIALMGFFSTAQLFVNIINRSNFGLVQWVKGLVERALRQRKATETEERLQVCVCVCVLFYFPVCMFSHIVSLFMLFTSESLWMASQYFTTQSKLCIMCAVVTLETRRQQSLCQNNMFEPAGVPPLFVSMQLQFFAKHQRRAKRCFMIPAVPE